jgi:hypothetical protein
MNADTHCNATCPSCFESFSVPGPAPSEVPTDWDYDCEICCRPMVIHFYLDDERVIAEADSDQ